MTEIVKKMKNLGEYELNEDVDDVFVLANKTAVVEYRNGYSFGLKIQDAGGFCTLKFWGPKDQEQVQSFCDSLKLNGVVRIKGKISEYNGERQISINNSDDVVLLPVGSYLPSDFIRKSDKDASELLKELNAILSEIKNEEVKQIVYSFYGDDSFIEKFVNCPAAMRKHHGWVGGLLEHTLSVVKICLEVSKINDGLDKDILIAGATLHDIGKIAELETTTKIDYTTEGNLLGHIVLGVQMLTRKLDDMEISEGTKQKLIHMLVSHHGKYEFGSPKTPCFPEALVVHYADELDAKTTQMLEEIKEKKIISENKFQWSRDFNIIMVDQ